MGLKIHSPNDRHSMLGCGRSPPLNNITMNSRPKWSQISWKTLEYKLCLRSGPIYFGLISNFIYLKKNRSHWHSGDWLFKFIDYANINSSITANMSVQSGQSSMWCCVPWCSSALLWHTFKACFGSQSFFKMILSEHWSSQQLIKSKKEKKNIYIYMLHVTVFGLWTAHVEQGGCGQQLNIFLIFFLN